MARIVLYTWRACNECRRAMELSDNCRISLDAVLQSVNEVANFYIKPPAHLASCNHSLVRAVRVEELS
jgi:hypothetical protein